VVTIGMNYFVRDSKEEIFEAACGKMIDLMRRIEGHDESHVYRCVDRNDPVYLVVSRWESEGAFGDFVAPGSPPSPSCGATTDSAIVGPAGDRTLASSVTRRLDSVGTLAGALHPMEIPHVSSTGSDAQVRVQ